MANFVKHTNCEECGSSDAKAACERLGLKHVPIIVEATEIKEQTIESLLQYAEGKSMLNGSNREGVVFKSNAVHDRSFKVVSNKWLQLCE